MSAVKNDPPKKHFDGKTEKVVSMLCKVPVKLHCSTCAIQEHSNESTILDDRSPEMNLSI